MLLVQLIKAPSVMAATVNVSEHLLVKQTADRQAWYAYMEPILSDYHCWCVCLFLDAVDDWRMTQHVVRRMETCSVPTSFVV